MSDAEEGSTTAEEPTVTAEEPTAAAEEPAAAGDGADAGTGAEARHDAPVCQVAWCPLCFAVGAVQPIQPEVVEHLLRAGTEMLLAFRVGGRRAGDGVRPAADDAPGGTRLEKIDLG